MEELKKDGKYAITPSMQKELDMFEAFYASEKDTAEKIKSLYDDTGYVIDTHTAVAASAYDKYKKESGDETVSVIASTASPFKFTRSVMNAIPEAFPVCWNI